MPTLEPIASLLLEFRREGRDAFLKTHTSPFLLVRPPEAKRKDGGGEWGGFNTETFRMRTSQPVGNWSDEELDAAAKAEDVRVLEIAKSKDSPWRGRISIGRARNNDLVVSSAGVSKLHAHFTTDDDGVTRVTDAGSHNGTRVNETRIEQGVAVILNPHDKLTFGDVQAVFHTPASLCEFLGSLFA
jgi:pSer/pThr/pTyr-binding forkhead associated (FHA) protein